MVSAKVFGHVLRLGWSAARWLWLVSLMIAVVTGLTSPVAAWLSRLLVDSLTAARPDAGLAVTLAVLAAGSTVIGSLISTAGGVISAKVQRSVALTVSEQLYSAVSTTRGIAHIEDPIYQDKLQLAENAAAQAPMQLSSTLLNILQIIVMMTAFVGGLFAVWRPLPVLMLAVVIPSLVAQRALARRQAATFEEAAPHHRNRLIYRILMTSQYGGKESRAFGLGGFMLQRMLDAHRRAEDLQLRTVRSTAWTESLVAVAIGCVTMASAGYVGLLAAGHSVTVGDFVFFTLAVSVVQASIAGLLTQISILLSSSELFGHYTSILEMPDQVACGQRQVRALGDRIEFEHVWFRYKESADWVLKDVSFAIGARSTIGIVGVNGTGKSTVVKLLCRLYEPTRGIIRWDGIDVRELSIDELMARITVTFQDFATYDLIAAESIGVGKLSELGNRPVIRKASRMAEMDDVISQLPVGYDTLLSERFIDPETGFAGVTLSGGQNQRLALARSFMRLDADLMILDEPTAGIDAEAEDRIYRWLRERRRGKTNVIVTHRLGLLSDVDEVLVFEDSKLAESGTPRDLVAAGGSYARLFAIQSAGYVVDAAAAEDAPRCASAFDAQTT